MSRSLMKVIRTNQESTFTLQITSMIDMFTIILVFLLKSYSSSAVDAAPSQGVRLPSSTSTEKPSEALKLQVSQKGIFLDDKLVVILNNGVVPKDALDSKDDKFIRPLYENLMEQEKKTKDIAKQNETVQFEGKLIFQADQSLNYEMVRKIMYTASLAGYSDFKFAVISLQ